MNTSYPPPNPKSKIPSLSPSPPLGGEGRPAHRNLRGEGGGEVASPIKIQNPKIKIQKSRKAAPHHPCYPRNPRLRSSFPFRGHSSPSWPGRGSTSLPWHPHLVK